MLLLAATLMTFVTMVRMQCLTPGDDERAAADPSSPKVDLYHGQLPFSLNMLRTLNTESPRTNLFFSPLSVYSTLVLAYFISANDTEKSLHKALYLPDGAVSIVHSSNIKCARSSNGKIWITNL